MPDIYDIETRIASIVNKYKAYDEEEKKERPVDAFDDLYFQMEGTIDSLNHVRNRLQRIVVIRPCVGNSGYNPHDVFTPMLCCTTTS
mmetsp:Transcript_26396/g.44209  ORF Transcript_26396/g.44209 Transcript_26396/m.44209 type:complete len:87 (+) Transcript_26396:351-611(+)